jgi:hypothetical protein
MRWPRPNQGWHTVGVQKYLLTPRVAKPMSKQYFDAAFKTRILKLY